ncbi:hypothetical protein CAOG_04829 [Capsaspora owczarzaki ATCC 30864]|uniref:Interferon-related developmental regulator N-terminal domain-containing protein n=1 Tax=Capsaspora owczarzaki (strain ATCC 30864) TaxID=595528 RepID=A0A0D2X3E0_CAPO3|nr:hypothetical protein CAOG_04829 [Capsaspora owczarzaki ATCC 30864]KJE94144.1 hypothetical protein CAOG_004829 [Capsaspora owczarzaki ATCC 30864]|eukprot:XP_004347580.2 hypothetical protein CAOG_04829 [Capsaspora owczarzaki ATCC 30864]
MSGLKSRERKSNAAAAAAARITADMPSAAGRRGGQNDDDGDDANGEDHQGSSAKQSNKRNARRGGGGRAASVDDSDDDASSVTSGRSGAMSDDEDAGSGEPEHGASAVESHLQQVLDALRERRSILRSAGLSKLIQLLQKFYLPAVFATHKVSLLDGIEKCLKGSEDNIRATAASAVTLVVLQLGSEVSGELGDIITALRTYASAAATNSSTRAACVAALSWTVFITSEDPTEVTSTMQLAQELFSRAQHQTEAQLAQNGQAHTVSDPDMVAAAIVAWGLLLPRVPSTARIVELSREVVRPLTTLLASSDHHIRLAASETLAAVFELGRALVDATVAEGGRSKSFDSHFQVDDICEQLDALCSDSVKSRAKAERTRERSVLRQVKDTLEAHEGVEETVKLLKERFVVDTWESFNRLNQLRAILHSGFQPQLMSNPLLRDMFDLSPVANDAADGGRNAGDDKRNKAAYFAAVSKARSMYRNKNRDRRQASKGRVEDDDE